MFDEQLLNPLTRGLLSKYLKVDLLTAQSVILRGDKGLGKRTVGEEIAKFLLNYGGEYRIDKHPDFYRLEPKDGAITKAQTDAVREFVNIYASIAPRKVVLVDDADLIGNSAANSLLKVLEDDNKTCVFIFIAHSGLLPTIMSRCVEIDFSAVEIEALQVFLAAGVNDLALLSSGGKIGQYQKLSSNGLFLAEAGKIVETLNTMNNPRELLTTCHAVKEKDGSYLYDVLDVEERVGLFILLQGIFQHHLLKLYCCGEELSFINGNNLEQFYDIDCSMVILNELQRAIKLSGKKGKFSKNDFFELLTKFVYKKGECGYVISKNEATPI